MKYLFLVMLLSLGVVGCSSDSLAPKAPPNQCEGWITSAAPCNGDEALCDRPYDQVAYLTTHNAMSNAAEEWFWPNQNYGIERQLADGVRALMIDTHYDESTSPPTPSLCHGHCALGRIALTDALESVRDFLRCNPQQVVTLIVEAYISGPDTREAFEETGLTQFAYAHPADMPWPTLGELIALDKRLIVLSDEGGTDDWYMQVWEHAVETPFSAESIDDLSCETNRGSPGNALFILNHFLSAPLPSPQLAEAANYNPLLSERAIRCQDEFGQIPNFVTVDFYDIGDGASVVDQLNTP